MRQCSTCGRHFRSATLQEADAAEPKLHQTRKVLEMLRRKRLKIPEPKPEPPPKEATPDPEPEPKKQSQLLMPYTVISKTPALGAHA